MSSLTVPGKVFLIGEYSVLQGGIGLFAALKPGYAFDIDETRSREWMHPESPIGIYQRDTGHAVAFEKNNSSQGPGFGSSTAELIAGVYADLDRLPESKRLWAWYREFFPRASGADLIAQIEALKTGSSLFEIENGTAGAFSSSELLAEIQMFQINPELKLPTHEALKRELPVFDVANLNRLVKQVKAAVETNSRQGLLAMNEYADLMRKAGVETNLANETRLAFSEISGVYATKGCGAGLHDVFLVATERLNSDLSNALHQVADAFGLESLGSLRENLW